MELNSTANSPARKVLKGFTLVEMIVVIAIIAILASIGSWAIQGFIRDAKFDTMNRNAQIVYEAFQDILIDCEVSQDCSIFEGHDGENTKDIRHAIVFFRISDRADNGTKNKSGVVGLGDEIHVMTTHTTTSPNAFIPAIDDRVCSRSYWKHDTDNDDWKGGAAANGCLSDCVHGTHGEKAWARFNSFIEGRIDKSMVGTYCVMLDLDDYRVLSVICRELYNGRDPKTGLYGSGEAVDGNDLGDIFGNKGLIKWTNSLTNYDGDTVTFQQRTYFIKNAEHEKKILTQTNGVYVGCYPFGDMEYTDVTM